MNTKPNLEYETQFWSAGHNFVAGMDEVGRGAFAGPVVVGAVVFDKNFHQNLKYQELNEVNDSKKLTPRKREELSPIIKRHALFWSVGAVAADVIDKIGIICSLKLAAEIAIARIPADKLYLLTDHNLFPARQLPANATEIVGGDARCFSIAAASILAKFWRDEYMSRIGQHPQLKQYQWHQNAGYGTKHHRRMISLYGSTFFHRQTFLKHKSKTQS